MGIVGTQGPGFSMLRLGKLQPGSISVSSYEYMLVNILLREIYVERKLSTLKALKHFREFQK